MNNVYKPLEAISNQRLELSKSFSALRRVKPRVPFWQLAVHRIPTLWSLYRGLLRDAPGDNIRFRMRLFFDRHKCLTSPTATRQRLLQAHKFLDTFRSAKEGNEKLSRVLARYDSMIGAKRRKEQLKDMIRKELEWQDRLRHRPIMTGGFIRPTPYNSLLPRLKPQPKHITMMIHNRRKAHKRKVDLNASLPVHQEHLRIERWFEERLLQDESAEGRSEFEPVYDIEEWFPTLLELQSELRQSFDRGASRTQIPYPPDLLAQIKEARREKIRNKTRERERERRGEILPRTIKRSRKGPPAHVLAKMTPEQRHADKVIRSVSEVGYVGMMKHRMGVKMKNPNLWRELEGDPEASDDQWEDDSLASEESGRSKG